MEDRKNLVKRIAATTAVAGALALGGVITAGTASAETAAQSGSSVLTNVTPGDAAYGPESNVGCCQSGPVTNFSCC